MLYLYLSVAPTTARKEAAARVARKAYEKRKTRAAQDPATREQAAADAEVDSLPDKPFWPHETAASLDVTPLRGRGSWALDEASATGVSTSASMSLVLLKDIVQAAMNAAAVAPHPAVAAAPQR
jgi:hypothetical protein